MANTADIFNEWARRYAADPCEFDVEILDADGNPVTDYGQRAAIYFRQLEKELDATNQADRNR